MFGNTSHWCTCKSHDWLDNSRTYTLKASLHAASWLLPHFRIILSSAVSRSCAVDFVSACTLQTSLPGTLFFSCKKRKKSKSALLMMRFFFFLIHTPPVPPRTPTRSAEHFRLFEASEEEAGGMCRCNKWTQRERRS